MALSPSPLAAVVLCAGKGTRMKSARAKVLHPILGRPLFAYPVSRALEVGATRVVLVVGHQAEEVTAAAKAEFPEAAFDFALQAEQKGTAHAVGCAEAALKAHAGDVLILYGDTPLLAARTLEALKQARASSGGPLAFVTTRPPTQMPYGRVVREGGRPVRIVEDKDCTPEEKALTEVNAGIYLVESSFLWKALSRIGSSNAQGEYYLTDIVAMAAAEKGGAVAVECDFAETLGVNDRLDLASCAKLLQERILRLHMVNGVSVEDPSRTVVHEGVSIGPDTVLEPDVTLRRGTKLGAGVRVGQGCVIERSEVADGVELRPYSVLEDAKVGPRSLIGPFARLRPGTELGTEVHIGNFVETKKARIGDKSKANHLAYLGDAEIGKGCNVGAGTITCNYDGVNKHLTRLGDGVFIGSDSQLVAPVSVGEGAYVGAGTTLTHDVPARSLALSRTPQVVKEGWVDRKNAVKTKVKAGSP